MGYYTQYGYMLDGVLYATDREAFESKRED